MDVIVPPAYEAALRRLCCIFVEENTRINLSAHRTEEACWLGNIVDSLPALALLEQHPLRILDVGSGGGFPALPLALCRPDCAVAALDSTKKKMAAVERIAQAMGIANLTTIGMRAEEAAHNTAYRGRYDVVTARAVAALPTLLELTAPFATSGGRLILWKSMHAADEVAASTHAQKKLGIRLESSTAYRLPDPWGERTLLVFNVERATPRAYPRATGIPNQKPL